VTVLGVLFCNFRVLNVLQKKNMTNQELQERLKDEIYYHQMEQERNRLSELDKANLKNEVAALNLKIHLLQKENNHLGNELFQIKMNQEEKYYYVSYEGLTFSNQRSYGSSFVINKKALRISDFVNSIKESYNLKSASVTFFAEISKEIYDNG
jgi:hypothetical protein